MMTTHIIEKNIYVGNMTLDLTEKIHRLVVREIKKICKNYQKNHRDPTMFQLTGKIYDFKENKNKIGEYSIERNNNNFDGICEVTNPQLLEEMGAYQHVVFIGQDVSERIMEYSWVK